MEEESLRAVDLRETGTGAVKTGLILDHFNCEVHSPEPSANQRLDLLTLRGWREKGKQFSHRSVMP